MAQDNTASSPSRVIIRSQSTSSSVASCLSTEPPLFVPLPQTTFTPCANDNAAELAPGFSATQASPSLFSRNAPRSRDDTTTLRSRFNSVSSPSGDPLPRTYEIDALNDTQFWKVTNDEGPTRSSVGAFEKPRLRRRDSAEPSKDNRFEAFRSQIDVTSSLRPARGSWQADALLERIEFLRSASQGNSNAAGSQDLKMTACSNAVNAPQTSNSITHLQRDSMMPPLDPLFLKMVAQEQPQNCELNSIAQLNSHNQRRLRQHSGVPVPPCLFLEDEFPSLPSPKSAHKPDHNAATQQSQENIASRKTSCPRFIWNNKAYDQDTTANDMAKDSPRLVFLSKTNAQRSFDEYSVSGIEMPFTVRTMRRKTATSALPHHKFLPELNGSKYRDQSCERDPVSCTLDLLKTPPRQPRSSRSHSESFMPCFRHPQTTTADHVLCSAKRSAKPSLLTPLVNAGATETKTRRLSAHDSVSLGEFADLEYKNRDLAPLSIFIGNIPDNTTQDTLLRQMQSYGKVVETLCDFRDSGWHTAFVTFGKPSEAAKAIVELNSRRVFKNMNPHRLVCCYAPYPPQSMRNSSWSKNNIAGAEGSNGKRRPTQSTTAFKTEGKVMRPLPIFFPKFSADVDIDSPRKAPPVHRISLLRDGPPGANLFIYGIPSDWREITLMRLCQKFGHIVGVRVPESSDQEAPPSNRGFGFVSYDSKISAQSAMDELTRLNVCGKLLNVQLKAGDEQNPVVPPPRSVALPLSSDAHFWNDQQVTPAHGHGPGNLVSDGAPELRWDDRKGWNNAAIRHKDFNSITKRQLCADAPVRCGRRGSGNRRDTQAADLQQFVRQSPLSNGTTSRSIEPRSPTSYDNLHDALSLLYHERLKNILHDEMLRERCYIESQGSNIQGSGLRKHMAETLPKLTSMANHDLPTSEESAFSFTRRNTVTSGEKVSLEQQLTSFNPHAHFFPQKPHYSIENNRRPDLSLADMLEVNIPTEPVQHENWSIRRSSLETLADGTAFNTTPAVKEHQDLLLSSSAITETHGNSGNPSYATPTFAPWRFSGAKTLTSQSKLATLPRVDCSQLGEHQREKPSTVFPNFQMTPETPITTASHSRVHELPFPSFMTPPKTGTGLTDSAVERVHLAGLTDAFATNINAVEKSDDMALQTRDNSAYHVGTGPTSNLLHQMLEYDAKRPSLPPPHSVNSSYFADDDKQKLYSINRASVEHYLCCPTISHPSLASEYEDHCLNVPHDIPAYHRYSVSTVASGPRFRDSLTQWSSQDQLSSSLTQDDLSQTITIGMLDQAKESQVTANSVNLPPPDMMCSTTSHFGTYFPNLEHRSCVTKTPAESFTIAPFSGGTSLYSNSIEQNLRLEPPDNV